MTIPEMDDETRLVYEKGQEALGRLLDAIRDNDPEIIMMRMTEVAALGGKVTFSVCGAIAGMIGKAYLGDAFRNMPPGAFAMPQLTLLSDGSHVPLDDADPSAVIATQFVAAIANEDLPTSAALFAAAVDLGPEKFTDFMATIVGNACLIAREARRNN